MTRLAFLLPMILAQDLLEQYEQKWLMAPQNAKGQYDLGKWCEQHRLKEQAMQAYERSIEIDPEFEPARKALGHKKVLGRWTSEKNYADSSWWAHPKVDQKRVDEAIVKGCRYLLGQLNSLSSFKCGHHKDSRYDELALLTLLEAGWDRRDGGLQALLQRVLSLPVDRTYHVALRAMSLASLDPLRYQQHLAQCAQFLVDNQCPNGQWSYGEPVPSLPSPGTYPTTGKGPIPDISTGIAEPAVGKKGAAAPKQIEIKKGRSAGPGQGDNSNSQYASLGIRACLSGLVVVPKETIALAEEWWEKKQMADGGWGYDNSDGWMAGSSWGSMTAGAVGGLAIYKYYRHRVWGDDVDWKNASTIAKGAAWMGKNLRFPENPGYGSWHLYWVYAVERAGRLLETERFGSQEWYPKGAAVLLDSQQPDGSWKPETWSGLPKDSFIPGNISETCFAILFLRRATPRLDETIKIQSGDRKIVPNAAPK
jgi:hypothetical protein